MPPLLFLLYIIYNSKNNDIFSRMMTMYTPVILFIILYVLSYLVASPPPDAQRLFNHMIDDYKNHQNQ